MQPEWRVVLPLRVVQAAQQAIIGVYPTTVARVFEQNVTSCANYGHRQFAGSFNECVCDT